MHFPPHQLHWRSFSSLALSLLACSGPASEPQALSSGGNRGGARAVGGSGGSAGDAGKPAMSGAAGAFGGVGGGGVSGSAAAGRAVGGTGGSAAAAGGAVSPGGGGGLAGGGAAGTSLGGADAAGRGNGGAGGRGDGGFAGSARGGAGGAGASAGGVGAVSGRGGASAGTGGAASGAGGGSSYQPCPTSGACKIMPFGDSITEGYDVQGGYRAPLFHLAHQAGHTITFVGSASDYSPATVDGVAFPPNHEGHGGYTIDDNSAHNTKGISPLVASSMKSYTPNIVTLMIGTNDINDNIDVSNAPARLGTLLDSIYAANADVLIVLAQIVPTTNDTTNQAVQSYNAGMPALVSARTSMGRHLILVDMYAAFTSDSSYKTTLMGDGLHPNQAGYNRMGDTWYAALEPYLR
jgi:lysophospholipase L1-like esterase